MKEWFSLLALIIFTAIIVIFAVKDKDQQTTDPQCVSDCKQRGFEPEYCQKRCSFDPRAEENNKHEAAPQCMNDCTRSGHEDAYCTNACTY